MKIKVCGMKVPSQLEGLHQLGIDYAGFIFYPKSARYVGNLAPIKTPKGLKRIGVFVNEKLEVLVQIAQEWKLDYLQLHGDESVAYCKELKVKNYQLIKVFGIKEAADFEKVEEYQELCDYYLFDTKGKERGGNGYAFNWQLLEHYTAKKSFFLSGGIALGDEPIIQKLAEKDKRLLGVDLNSKFEKAPSDKDLTKLTKFVSSIKNK